MKNVGYYNGKIAPIEEITIPMNDRVVYFGDGVYDAAFVRNYKIFAEGDHLDRFYNSCRLLEIDFTMPREELSALLNKLVSLLDGGQGILYWQTTRGTAPRNHAFPDTAKVRPNLLAYVNPKPDPDFKTKLDVISADDIRYEMCNIKTLNLIPNCMAASKAERAGCGEVVFHRGDVVTEGCHSNISIIKDGRFITHPLDRFILPGTVRKHILALCREYDIPVEERYYTLGELKNADELCYTSATALLRSAKTLDGSPIGGKAPQLLEKLQNGYWNRILNEIK
ncbi:MAG: aminotransferase class IV [Eubacteriales bacterium]